MAYNIQSPYFLPTYLLCLDRNSNIAPVSASCVVLKVEEQSFAHDKLSDLIVLGILLQVQVALNFLIEN